MTGPGDHRQDIKVVIVMGVSGVGKTTIGERLAAALAADYAEGDRYHPPVNVEKMRAGHALTDDDRRPWLERLALAIGDWCAGDRKVVLACSALKESYRKALRARCDDVVFVYLKASEALIRERVASRQHEYMPASLLSSQLQTLEEPDDAIVADASKPPEVIVADILAALTSELGAGKGKA